MSIADYGFAIWETFYVTVLSTAFALVLGLPLVAAYTSAMGWALTVGEGPGMSLQFTLPAAPPLDGMVLTSPTERLADRQNRRRLIRRELAVLVADTSIQ